MAEYTTGGRGSAGARSATGRFILCHIDDMRFILAQGELVSLELRADLQPESVIAGAVGELRGTFRGAPVFCVDGQLHRQATIGDQRAVVLVLSASPGLFGLLVDRVETVGEDAFRLCDLPACLSTGDSPLAALAVRQDGGADEVAFLLDVGVLASELQHAAQTSDYTSGRYGSESGLAVPSFATGAREAP